MREPAVPRYNPAVPSTPKRLDDDLDKFHEECALFGIYGTSDAAAHTALGLHALQHRGQEAAGIVTFDGQHFHAHRAAGPGRRHLRRAVGHGQAEGLFGDRP